MTDVMGNNEAQSFLVLDREGERRLATAVLKLAVEDARKGDRAALDWLRSDKVTFWLSILEIDATLGREWLHQAADGKVPWQMRLRMTNSGVAFVKTISGTTRAPA